MAHIDFFCTTLSPYNYMCGLRPAQIAARTGATITYKPFDAIAGFSRTGGLALPDRHPSRLAYRLQELRRQSQKAGLELNINPAYFPVSIAPSSHAMIAAQDAHSKDGKGDLAALLHGFGRACWAEERNISDAAVVRAVLVAAGFAPELAQTNLALSEATYAANLEEAVARGVFGTPFFITDTDERFWGQDRLDDLEHHLAS
ncbi:MAG: 2-hydroxychromene-2-carboxylate isomerase [Rhodobacteraceae bacterium]|nr:2-hydroxychromene-2-carboxylate isomerase [Paracoccaceae bacterium]